jgi:two-component system chemotaxis sensor kinase CheA
MATPAETFAQEAEDTLATLEEKLLELEGAPGDPELVNAVFRALHTLKGSGEMFGYLALAGFVHHLETTFDQVREGRTAVSPDLIGVALDSRDHIAALLSARPDESAESAAAKNVAAQALTDRVRALQADGDAPVAQGAAPAVETAPAGRRRVDILFQPEPSALRHGLRVDMLFDELAELGPLAIACLADDVPPVEALDPAECRLAWRLTLETEAPRGAIEDVFIFAMDGRLEITDPADAGAPSAEDAAEDAAPAPDASGAADAPAPQPAAEKPAADKPATDKPAAHKPAAHRSAAAAEPAPRAAKPDSMRVQAHRLDALMDQIGELVIAQARLHSISGRLRDPALEAAAEEIERLVTGLRDTTLSIRMLPISLVFGKFRRVVRDLSGELGKAVTLEAVGGETEVDKNVIDSLTEPLVHMVRNAIDHGIETPEARRAAGKPETATVTMRARQSGGEVHISVSDDGAGLDAAAIRRKAVSRGLIGEDETLSDEALHQLIFAPGFSTAETVTNLSGRGVGMDAVRRVVVDLRGGVDVRSTPGKGTEVTLRLPLTLAIIEGMLVRVGDGAFVIPLWSVEECVELPTAENARKSGRSILRIRDALVPFLALDAQFGFEPSQREGRRVVIVNADGRRIGLVVDDVIGQHQTVIKPLSLYHRDTPGLAGGTILGDGAVALILDIPALVKRAQGEQQQAA